MDHLEVLSISLNNIARIDEDESKKRAEFEMHIHNAGIARSLSV
jgi:hypothetical protein